MKVRRGLMVLALVLGCSLSALLSARAQLEDQALRAARHMLDLPASWLRGGARHVLLNGARIEVSSGRSELSLTALLDHLQARCRAHSGGMHALVQRATGPAPKDRPSLFDGVLRIESEQVGMVACLELGQGTLTLEQFAERLARFAQQADLAELGGVRLVRVEAREHGSFFVAAASEGSVPLKAMFPAQGDAPGADFAALPRPVGSRRLFSAWEEHSEPALGMYESPAGADELWADYTEALAKKGWSLADRDAAQSAGSHAALLTRGGHSAVLVVERRGPRSLIALMPTSAGPGAVRVATSGRADLSQAALR